MAFVLLGDLIGSRRVVDRPGTGRRVDELLDEIHAQHARSLAARPERTQGIDGIALVLTDATAVASIILDLNVGLAPSAFRFGLGRGSIDVRLSDRVADMDGPAFHAAAGAMERAEKERLPLGIDIGALPAACRLGELLLGHCQAIIVSWARRAREISKAYRRAGDVTQTELSHSLGISQQAVSAALRRAHWRELRRNEEGLRAWLQTLHA